MMWYCVHVDYTSTNDEELAFACAHDDAQAFQELTHRYARRIFNFTKRYVKEDDVAEDITQDTFLKAWKHIKRFKSGYLFKTWIFTIARNTALDHIKKTTSIVFSSLDNDQDDIRFSDSIADDDPLPPELFARKELRTELEKAMDTLPVEHRAVITMHYHDEMTFEEIAVVMKKPMNTVKSWHRRSLIKMRQILMDQTHQM